MGLIKLFVSKKRIDRRISELLIEKKVLGLRIETQVLVEMAKMYPNQSLDELKLKYPDKIKEVTQSLYQEYVFDINKRVRELNGFKNHLYSQ